MTRHFIVAENFSKMALTRFSSQSWALIMAEMRHNIRRMTQVMFVNKALQEYKVGNVAQAILLVTANTTVRWFQPLWNYPMCTPFSKIGFILPGCSQRQRQVFGNVFVYLGPHEAQFISVFSRLGVVTRRVFPQS
jgi:hypothetical protein